MAKSDLKAKAKTDCFAYCAETNTCKVLIDLFCGDKPEVQNLQLINGVRARADLYGGECRFYKTKNQCQADRIAAKEALKKHVAESGKKEAMVCIATDAGAK